MSRLVVTIVVLVALAGVGLGLKSLTPAQPSRDAAPAFTIHTLDGRTLKLPDLRGRPVVLDFWATWCVPCRASMPHLSVMQDRYRARGLVVVGLSVDDIGPAPVRRFAERLKTSFPIAMADERVLDDFGPIRSIPTTIFIDRRGQIVRRVVGYVDEDTLEGFVREIL